MIIEYPSREEVEEISGLSRKDFFEKHGYNWEHIEKILRLHKRYKSVMNCKSDDHHLIPRHRGGMDVQANRRKMYRFDHIAHHDRFGVATPDEQIIEMVEFNAPVLCHQTRTQIQEQVEKLLHKHQFYKQGMRT